MNHFWTKFCYLLDLDFVHLLHGSADLWLVGLDVDDEDERVVVFDLLHRRFGREWVLDRRELIESGRLRRRFGRAFRVARKTERRWAAEVHGGAHLVDKS